MTDFAHFPRPGENYPYVHCGSYVHVMAELVCYQLYSVFVRRGVGGPWASPVATPAASGFTFGPPTTTLRPPAACLPQNETFWLSLHLKIGGGIFSQVLILQAFSDVMVIIGEVSTLQRGQFANLGPHPAILLFWFPHYRAKNKSCRKLYIWVSNTISRKIQEQWKKI